MILRDDAAALFYRLADLTPGSRLHAEDDGVPLVLTLEGRAKRLVGLLFPPGTGHRWRGQEEKRHGHGGQADYTETGRHAQPLSKAPATTVEPKIAQN
jgi:hypothetical protein